MYIWVLFAIMTAGLIGAVTAPLWRGRGDDSATSDPAVLPVYKSQMTEIEQDLERGVITQDDAALLRAEVGRRILSHSAPIPDPDDAGPTSEPPRLAVLAIVAGVPVLALGIYLSLGSPLVPSQPHALRVHQDAGNARVAELVRRVEARLAAKPDDGMGWDVIAPVYMRLGRYEDASNAFRIAGQLLGETAARVIGYAEASIFAGDGIVSEDARGALTRVVELRPDYLPARFWLAVARQQDGDLRDAREDLVALREQNASIQSDEALALARAIEERIGLIDARLRGVTAPSSVTSEGAADGGDATATAEMIERMVRGLAARLAEDGNDFDGWRRLIRSYVVLDRAEDARKALARAKSIFAADANRLTQLRALAKELKLET